MSTSKARVVGVRVRRANSACRMILIKGVNLILEKMTMPLKSYNKLWFVHFSGERFLFFKQILKGDKGTVSYHLSNIFTLYFLSGMTFILFSPFFSYAKIIFFLILQVTDYLVNKTTLTQPSRVHCSLGYKQHYFFLY